MVCLRFGKKKASSKDGTTNNSFLRRCSMIRERAIEYTHNGTVLEGLLAYDDSKPGPLPGVLISHAWGGREDFECQKARDLAALGYAGFALDLYGKGMFGSGPEENMKLLQPFLDDRPMLQDRLISSLTTFSS